MYPPMSNSLANAYIRMAMTQTPDNDPTPTTDARPSPTPGTAPELPTAEPPIQQVKSPMPKEIGGPAGPEPTRFGDWERKGRVSDF
jgi:hypothetical protein